MRFNEQYTVEKCILDFLKEHLNFKYINEEDFSKLRESDREYIIIPLLKKALTSINENISEDAIAHIIQNIQNINTNKEFLEILRNGVTVQNTETQQTETHQLLDFKEPENNHFVVTDQFSFEGNSKNIIPDIVVVINGLPLVIIEAKSPVAKGVSFEDGVEQIERYEREAQKLFIPNCFNIATDGLTTVYGATGAPKKHFWRWKDRNLEEELEHELETTLHALLEKNNFLDIVQNFILFEQTGTTEVKKIARYQQFRAVNKIVNRVVSKDEKQGLIWHTQGSGKTLTMFFAAWKLRFHHEMNNPPVFILVDRVDLDNQMYEVFTNAGGQNVERVTSRKDLKEKILALNPGIYITTIQKFSELDVHTKNLNENVIVLSDEAHRSDEGEAGIRMRSAFPNAFFFGFTSTPIDKKNRNTFRNYGVEAERYLDYYSIQQAINDGATVPVTYEARLSKFFINEELLESEFKEITRGLSEEEQDRISRELGIKDFVEHPNRMKAIAQDIIEYHKAHVEPSGFKAQIVAYSRDAVAAYKELLDAELGPECSAVVFSSKQNDPEHLRKYRIDKLEQEAIIKRFKNPNSPLKFLLVRDMLLTGFDAPIEQVMYLDRPLRDHALLQAIARTNRVYKHKEAGKVIDYFGITRNLTKALDFDEDIINSALVDIDEKKREFSEVFGKVMDLFSGVNTEDPSMDNLRKCLTIFIEKEELQEDFKTLYARLKGLYEFLSPDPFLGEYIRKFKWITSVYIAFLRNFEDAPDWKILEEYGKKVKELINESGMIDFEGITRGFRTMSIGELPIPGQMRDMEDKEKAFELERTLQAEISENIENPTYQEFSKRLSAIKRQFEERQIDLMERIREYKKMCEDIKREEERVQAIGLDLKEYGLFVILKNHLPETEESTLIGFVKDLTGRVVELLDSNWQNSPRRGEFIREIKQSLQKMLLVEYKDTFSVPSKEVPGILNDVTDIIEKKF